MKPVNRREALIGLAGSASLLWLSKGHDALGQTTAPRTGMGLVAYALGIHQRNEYQGRHRGLSPALAMLEESRRFGAAGIQCPLGADDMADAVRERVERYGMDFQAILTLPREESDLERFETDVRKATQAGAKIARTVIMPGRRYEQFKSLREFREFEQRGFQALQLAEPVVARHRLKLAVENHKDQRIHEKLAMLDHLSSEFIGLCVDLGNNIALLEDPLDTARAFARWALTVHIKDQAVREYEQGFLLADTALGEGMLDLPVIVKMLRDANPAIRFNLETITRDPLPVPILSDTFWVTMPDTPALLLARMLRLVKAKSTATPFPIVSKLPGEEQVALERQNIERSFTYAKEKLNL